MTAPGSGGAGTPRRRPRVSDPRRRAPAKAEVLGLVVVGEVAEAGHPDIAGDEHADGVVDLARVEVVVQQEQDLRRRARFVRAEQLVLSDTLQGTGRSQGFQVRYSRNKDLRRRPLRQKRAPVAVGQCLSARACGCRTMSFCARLWLLDSAHVAAVRQCSEHRVEPVLWGGRGTTPALNLDIPTGHVTEPRSRRSHRSAVAHAMHPGGSRSLS